MPGTDLSILVDAQVEAVFRFVSEPSNTLRYQRHFSRFDPIGSPRTGHGATADARGSLLGIPVRAKLRVIEFVPNRKIVARSVAYLKSSAEWHFSEEDGKTLVRFVASYDWPMPVMGPGMRLLLEAEIEALAEDSLRELKRLVEQEARGLA